MPGNFSIAVFISGRGSNLRSLIANAQSYQIIGVLTDRPEAPGLAYAAEHNIPTYAVSRAQVQSRKEQRAMLYDKLRALKPDLIALAGFMQIIDAEFVQEYFGRLINIHPSLLPAFPGLNTHEQALRDKASHHGCTVHYVDTGVDTGPIIAQACCDCSAYDSVDALAQRVLDLEHRLYPWVVNACAQGHIYLNSVANAPGSIVRISADKRRDAAAQQFILPNDKHQNIGEA